MGLGCFPSGSSPSETLAVIASSLSELPDAQRTVMSLRDVQGWSSDEVCEALDISPAISACSCIGRARGFAAPSSATSTPRRPRDESNGHPTKSWDAPHRDGESMTDAGTPSGATGPGAETQKLTEPPLHCVEVVELVTDYLDGVLTPSEVARLEAHLELCEPCVRYIEQVRATIAAVGSVEPEAVPPEVLSRLLHAYRELRGN